MRREVGLAAAALCFGLLAGCSGDDDSTSATTRPPTTTLDVAALGAWVDSLPFPEGIWWHCQAKVEADPAGTFTNLYLVAWDGYALADGPDDPIIAGMWRGFVEAGTVWASAVAVGVDEPGQLEALVESHAELTDELATHVDSELVAAALPAPPVETLDC